MGRFTQDRSDSDVPADDDQRPDTNTTPLTTSEDGTPGEVTSAPPSEPPATDGAPASPPETAQADIEPPDAEAELQAEADRLHAAAQEAQAAAASASADAEREHEDALEREADASAQEARLALIEREQAEARYATALEKSTAAEAALRESRTGDVAGLAPDPVPFDPADPGREIREDWDPPTGTKPLGEEAVDAHYALTGQTPTTNEEN